MSQQQLILGATHSSGFVIDNSVYSDGSSGIFSKTPSGVGTSRRIGTFSFWLKAPQQSGAANNAAIYASSSVVNNFGDIIFMDGSGTQAQLLKIQFDEGGSGNLRTNIIFRDVAAWYHLVVAWDTTQATAANRVKVYSNGVQITSFAAASYPAQNYDTGWMHNVQQYIFRRYYSANYYACYLSEFYGINGQQLTPSSFGEADSVTGSWKPKKYAGTYGINGFYLQFADAAALGKDSSGNSNAWTKTGTITQTTDSPTDEAASNIGNFCTLSPIHARNLGTLSGGNLKLTGIGAAYSMAYATISIPTTGKWAWKMTITTAAGGGRHGIVSWGSPDWSSEGGDPSQKPATYTAYVIMQWDGTVSHGYNTGGDVTDHAAGTSFVTNDYVEWLVDRDAGTVQIKKNGVAYQTVTGLPATVPLYVYGTMYNSGVLTWDFGQTSYAPSDSSYKRLNTANLPAPTIKGAGSHFKAVTYTGTGASLSVTGVGFQPDWVWIKGRSGATDNSVYDAVRGVQTRLETNTTDAEAASDNGVTAFGSDGFTVGTLAQTNTSTATYVAWCWKANGAGASNTSGTITSTVSANTTAGFSIVKWTGTAANATVGHGLGAVPKFIITKANKSVTEWPVYHTGLANTEYMALNTTAAKATAATYWNSTTPTSSVFSIGSSTNTNNTLGMIAYCFAEVAGFSKFGAYTGNGSADGPFVWCGFRPLFLLVRRSSAVDNWFILDGARNTENPLGKSIYPDGAVAENGYYGDTPVADFVSTGFKMRHATYQNNSGGIFVFAAFAAYPFGGEATTQGKAR